MQYPRTLTLVTYQNGIRPVAFVSNADLIASLDTTFSNAGGWTRKPAAAGGWQVWNQEAGHVATVQEIELHSAATHL